LAARFGFPAAFAFFPAAFFLIAMVSPSVDFEMANGKARETHLVDQCVQFFKRIDLNGRSAE
jgi:hypothetical protein